MKKKLFLLLSILCLVSCDSFRKPNSIFSSLSENSISSIEETTSSIEEVSSSISEEDSFLSSEIESTTSSESGSSKNEESSSENTTSSLESSTTSSNSSSVSSSSHSSSSSSSTSTSENKPTTSIKTNLYQATIENNIPEDYYKSCYGKKGEDLKKALHDIIKGHTWYDYNSTLNGYLKDIDKDPHDSSKLYFIYTGATSIGTSFNKEHVWAKSHGAFEDKNPMDGDLHNLHPCNSNLNSTRGNLDFAEGGTVISGYNGNNKRVNGVSFEPSDFSKGDTARTIFYMAVRYEGDGSEKDLELESPLSSNYYDFSSGADGVHGDFDDLYKWATSGQDPVDDYEVSRNNKIYESYQHNRNPFIDHPEFIQMIYDKNYNGPGALKDANPYEEVSQETMMEQFISLVESVNYTSLDASELIRQCEEHYSLLNEDSKKQVEEYYVLLQEKKVQHEEYYFQYYIDLVIRLINEIGEVSLSSLEKIEEAENAYNSLSDEQKEKVTNYQILLNAREQYDILVKENIGKGFTFDFASCSGATSSYASKTVTYNNMNIKFSRCFKTSNEDYIRFGHNDQESIDSKFSLAINSLESNSSSMEMEFDISGSKIELYSEGCFGTVSTLYLLKSNDGGKTWKLVNKETGDFSSTKVSSFTLDPSYSRYAFVIGGNKPRLKVSKMMVM